jgi:hypothetical protein
MISSMLQTCVEPSFHPLGDAHVFPECTISLSRPFDGSPRELPQVFGVKA